MSPRPRNDRAGSPQAQAVIFAALGDKTRLGLIAKLGDGQSHSISRLAADVPLTRQAITKHLRVLENAGIVRQTRAGRERRFELDPQPFEDSRQYLDFVSVQWDNALSRLQSFIAEPESGD